MQNNVISYASKRIRSLILCKQYKTYKQISVTPVLEWAQKEKKKY